MQSNFIFGGVELDAFERSLRIDGQPVTLGGRAFDLLVTLLQRAGSLVSKDELLDAVWGRTIVEEANLHVQVSALRKLLGPDVIATVPGRGYRFALALALGGPAARPDAGPAALPAGQTGVAKMGIAPLPLVGRAHDSAALLALMGEHRLVTITGAGGIGKTRLAADALWALRERHADGVATVELAALCDPALIVGAVAHAVKITLAVEGNALAALLAAVRPLDAVLLLDNAEHLIAAVAATAAALMDAAPSLRVLVTSQVPLHLVQERVFRLGGLDVPAGPGETTADEALAYGAIALFDDRLQAADRRARVNDDNVAAVLDICRKLDGTALAIELAAARGPLLGIRGVADRLDERFRLLRSSNRAAPSRQQTLGAAMDWSHSLLSAAQQAAFRQLGVFTGGFTLEMALRVIAVPGCDDVDAIDLLSELVDRSLIAVDAGEAPRYRLLETSRLFALAKLAEASETAVLRARHASVLREHFERAWHDSWLLPEASFVELYERDLDNLRAALDEALLHDPQAAIAMAGAATRLWRWLSLHPEAMARCRAAAALIDAATPTALEARLWEGMAQVSGELSHSNSRPAALRAAELYAQIGDARGRYLALAHLAFSHSGSGGSAPEAAAALAEMQRIEEPSWPAALRLFGRKIEANLALGDGNFEAARAATRARLELASACGLQRDVNAALGNLADLALVAGDADEAVRLGRSLLMRLRRRDAATRAMAQGNLLHALLAQGSDGEARVAAAEVVNKLRPLGFMFLMYICDALALLAAREERWPAAALLLGYADAAYAAQGQTRELNEARASEEARSAVAAHCSDSEVRVWLGQGAGLGAEDVCAIALERGAAAPPLLAH